jgi:protein-disulfide isomerase
MKKNVIFAVSTIALLALFAAGGYLYKKQQADKYDFMAREDASTFVRPHSPVLGHSAAKVVIVEFMDPGCETCRAFAPFLKQMIAANQGRIKLAIRYNPLHQGADTMVKILEAARKQGKYWHTLQLMYDTQKYWASHHKPEPEKIWEHLSRVAGLDLDMIKVDMQDPAIERIIEQDMADAKALNVQKTPEFFVNGKPLQSFGYEQLRTLIFTELEAQY